MKLKFVKNTTLQDQEYAEGEKVEIEDAETCQNLIQAGDAIEYTEDLEKADTEQAENELVVAEAERIKAETKSFKASNKNTEANGVKTMKDLIVKGFKDAFEKKAVADVSGVTATEFLGYVKEGQAAKVWAKLVKIANKETAKIVYENGAPTVSTVSEGGTNAQSALPISKTATAIKKFASFAVPTEYFESMDGMEDYLSSGIYNHVLKAVIKEMVDGTQTGTAYAGLEGIQASTDCLAAEFVSMTAPTKAELLAWKNTIDADLRDNMIFITPSDFAAGIETALLTEANVGNQLIDLANGKLFGKDWIITDAITTPVCGDFSKYIVTVARDFKVTATENSATDTVVNGASIRVAGGIAYKAGTTKAAFAKAVVAS